MAWHSTAWPRVLAAMLDSDNLLALFFTRPAINTYDSTGHLQIRARHSAICPCLLSAPSGWGCVRGSGNNSAAAVAHPPSQCTQRKTLAYNNTNVCAVAHPHSTLIMIHTKPHKYLPTSAQELQPNTNTEPKHIVESLSFSPRPDFFLCC